MPRNTRYKATSVPRADLNAALAAIPPGEQFVALQPDGDGAWQIITETADTPRETR